MIADVKRNVCVMTLIVVPSPILRSVDPRRPIGGHVVGHSCTTRLYFRKGRGDLRVARLADSPYLPEGDCTFAISSGGIADADE